ncbi:alkylhydroperoxidase [Niastella vici]|uniref:Alkylhydroperoxidase n=1 Tax=Niastella vici TaxID=1703345 RepID=A0A1V9GA09_9BACT|nr:carboxymuconolactone decarboxylase family protein [Niastella vici]OQP67412.1 alkylhydroperoxidase [Niastella vici]
MHIFKVPAREEVSEDNQHLFDNFKKMMGFVPNLLAMFAHSDTALADVLALSNRTSTLTKKEKEAINLIVSQVNGCKYCLAGHTVVARYAGFTDDEILQIRKAEVQFDKKLDVLVQFVKETTIQRGKPSTDVLNRFFEAGYTDGNLVDAIIAIAGKIITNYLHNITQIPVDWPAVPEI